MQDKIKRRVQNFKKFGKIVAAAAGGSLESPTECNLVGNTYHSFKVVFTTIRCEQNHLVLDI